MNKKIQLGQIGCGNWGMNLLRNFLKIDEIQSIQVAEVDEQRKKTVHSSFPQVEVLRDYRTILEDKNVDAVIIATPAGDHYHQTKESISTGIHYPLALPNLKAYEYLGHKPADFPVSSCLQEEVLSLPLFPELSESQIDYISRNIKRYPWSVI